MPSKFHAQGSPEWLAERKGKITASIAAACLGLDPNFSRQKAWRTVLMIEPEPDINRFMEWGNTFEARAREEYEVQTGHVAEACGFVCHPTIEWLGASPDGLIDENGLLEIKCPQNLPSVIPEKHIIQMQVQLACTGRKWCDYFAWTHQDHFLQRIEADYEVVLSLLEYFWNSYVVTKTQPPRKGKS